MVDDHFSRRYMVSGGKVEYSYIFTGSSILSDVSYIKHDIKYAYFLQSHRVVFHGRLRRIAMICHGSCFWPDSINIKFIAFLSRHYIINEIHGAHLLVMQIWWIKSQSYWYFCFMCISVRFINKYAFLEHAYYHFAAVALRNWHEWRYHRCRYSLVLWPTRRKPCSRAVSSDKSFPFQVRRRANILCPAWWVIVCIARLW